MKTVCSIISKNKIFKDIPKEIIYCILNSRACFLKKINMETKMFEVSDENSLLGIVVEGVVDIICTSNSGDENIVSRFIKGMNFWYSQFAIGLNVFNCIRSVCPSKILFINVNNLILDFGIVRGYKDTIFKNIISSFKDHNLLLNIKIQIMSQKTLRDKLLTYIEFLCDAGETREVTIPFNREQLACFLNSERSSISRELSKLEGEKIIKINRNSVVLLNRDFKN